MKKSLSRYGKFKLLLWKNWKIQLSRKIELLLELILPIVLGICLLVYKSKTSKYLIEEKRFEDQEISCDW